MADSTQIKVMVVDDEFPARKLLTEYISKVPTFTLVASYGDAVEALNEMQKQTIDLVFLDIQMPEMTGIDFVKSLSYKPMIVFTTAFSDYAIDSYELGAVYYLLKPISFPNFMKAANKAIEFFNLKRQASDQKETEVKTTHNEDDFLMVKADYKLYKINFDDIVYIEGQSEYVTFHLKDKKIVAYYSLKKLETELPANKFFRIHKSYIVSLDCIDAIEGNMVVIDNQKLAIGKLYKNDLMKVLCKE